MVDLARKRAVEMGALKNSITVGKANTAAFLAEIALSNHIGAEIADTYNHDLTVARNGNQYNIEVKTKRRTVDPKSYYEVSVAKTSNHQTPDYYAFMSITFGKVEGSGRGKRYYQPKRIWLCGYYPGDQYWRDSTPMNTGDIDHANGFVVHVPMYNMKISQLILPR